MAKQELEKQVKGGRKHWKYIIWAICLQIRHVRGEFLVVHILFTNKVNIPLDAFLYVLYKFNNCLFC